MTSKNGIKYGAMAIVALFTLSTANASLKQLEIKGKVSTAGYDISYNDGANALAGGGSDSVLLLDADLNFAMKFSQDVSARIDLQLDNAKAGDTFWVGQSATGADATSATMNRYGIGIDQAYVKMNDFMFKNFALSIGKQDLNISLRDNSGYSWSYGDPLSLVGNYATREMDLKGYFLKIQDKSTLAGASTNDSDNEIYGLTGEYWLNDDSLVLAYLNYKVKNTPAAATQNIIHYGIGLDYFIGEALELYGEVAGQNNDMGTTTGSAFQLNLGGQYTFADVGMKPKINLDYYFESGADGTDPAWDTMLGRVMAAENQSLFMEANGVRDLSFNGRAGGAATGYSVIRLNGWIEPSKNTKAGLGVHMFKNENNVAADGLGTEFDLTGSWKYTQDVTFSAGAFLWTGGQKTTSTDYEDVMGVSVASVLKF